MTTTPTTPSPTTMKERTPGRTAPIPPAAAWLLILGAFLSVAGFGWDVQWHSDVGPDTFFTLPHLILYSGTAIAGLTSLVLSLRILNDDRTAGDGLSLRHIPRPILLAGFGTVLFLANGLWDQWWYSIYGFDVTILSPPHIGLLTCIQIIAMGAIAAFAARSYGGRAAASAPLGVRSLGLALAVTISGTYLVFFQILPELIPTGGTGIDPVRLYLAAVFVGAMVTAASVLRTRFAATLVGAFVVVFKVFFGWFTLAATDWYASSLGLSIRDDSLAYGRSSEYGDALPYVVLLAGVLIDVVLLIGARRGLPGRWAVALAGAGSGLLLGIFYYVGTRTFGSPWVSPTTAVALLPVGVLTALVAWQFGNLARAVR
jgi:hypothetical protein